MQKILNRHQAGRLLAEHLQDYASQANVLILALPRGGVPIAYEIAQALRLPFDVYLVRKLGVPGHEEYAMGALTLETGPLLDTHIIRSLDITDDAVKDVISREQQELIRRERRYRGSRAALNVAGQTVILVDDGLATGATMSAAVKALQKLGAKKIVIAVPVAPQDTCNKLQREVDELICLYTPEPFYGVGAWYEDFTQVEDQEVLNLLEFS
jgi:predicted phosphoribosyltransferase